jgi:predicted NUDIX family phosphoesterase
MSKDNEMIMCVDKGRLFLLGMPTAELVVKATTAPGIATLRRRGDVETDTSLLQPIPYTVVIAPFGEDGEAKVLMYKRSSKGGETRLQDKYSIGVGGHINGIDVENYFASPTEDSPCSACMFRELFEELGVDELNCEAVMLSDKPIYDDSEAVSSVHIGLLYTVVLENVPNINVEDALTSVEWVNIQDLAQGTERYEKLEGWSKYVADLLVNSLAELEEKSE